MPTGAIWMQGPICTMLPAWQELHLTAASLGICHSLSHALGARFHIPHGRSNAILLPHVIAYNAGLEEAGETEALFRYARIANMLGISAGTPKATVHGLIRQIRNRMKRIGIPELITELGIDREEFQQSVGSMAAKALEDNCTATNQGNLL